MFVNCQMHYGQRVEVYLCFDNIQLNTPCSVTGFGHIKEWKLKNEKKEKKVKKWKCSLARNIQETLPH